MSEVIMSIVSEQNYSIMDFRPDSINHAFQVCLDRFKPISRHMFVARDFQVLNYLGACQISQFNL